MSMGEFEEKVKIYQKSRQKPTPTQEIIYLGEVHNVCPLCGRALIAPGVRKANKLFEIAHIFPCNPTPDDMQQLEGVELYGDDSESMHNKIALCKECHKDYDNNKTKEKYIRLLQKKKEYERQYSAKQEISKLKIEKELKNALARLQNLNASDLKGLTLNYNAICVNRKIEKDNFLLKNEIENHVFSYFMFIHAYLEEQCLISNADMELVSLAVKGAYLQCKKLKMNQAEIYGTLKEWLMSKVVCSDIAAAIIVSYFVQNCDVYDEIPE